MQDPKIAKNSLFERHRTTMSGYIFATKHLLTIGKSLFNSHFSPTCCHNTVNCGPLAAEICWRVWGTPSHFYGFRVTARHMGVNQILRHWTDGATYIRRAAILLGIGPHSSCCLFSLYHWLVNICCIFQDIINWTKGPIGHHTLTCVNTCTPCLKTSHLWLAITLTHVNGFWHFWQKCYR